MKKGYKFKKKNGVRIFEHRQVMEIKLGRPLESHERVHHIDEDYTNNDPSNLELMTKNTHAQHHGAVWKIKYKKDYTNGKFCTKCNQIKEIKYFLLRKDRDCRPRSWCNECEKAIKRQTYKETYKPRKKQIDLILLKELRSDGCTLKQLSAFFSVGVARIRNELHRMQ